MVLKINLWLSLIFKFGVLALAFLTPIFFWSYTTEFYETPKFTLLMLAVSLFTLLWVVKWVVSGRIFLTVSKLDIPFLLLLIAFIISMFFAASRPVAIFGNLPRIHGGLASYALYIVFYFVLAANLKKLATAKEVIYALLGSAVILTVMSLLSYAGVNILSLPWTAGSNFTPTGSSFSTAALLILLLPFPVSAILYGSKVSTFESSESKSEELDLPISSLVGNNTSLNEISVKTIWSVILGLFAVTLVLIGTLPIYIAAVIVFILVLFVTPPNLIGKNSAYLFIPIITAVLIAFISFVPIGGSKNIFYHGAQNFQREHQLPFDVSWKVSVSAFRDSPFWGSGPASYLGDFTLYKPIEFNNDTKLWNVRFDQAFNEYLNILATLGIIGLIVIIFLTVIAVTIAFKTLSAPRIGSIRLPLAVSTIAFFVILAVHASTLVLWVAGILIIVCFLAVTRQSDDEVYLEQSINGNNSFSSRINPFTIIAAILVLALVGLVLWQTTQALIADYHHRQGIKAASSGQGIIALNEFVLAEKYNPQADLYRNNLAQINYALANYIVGIKGPTEASPAGNLTDQDKQNIQTLLGNAINEGQAATILNPNNPANWEILASIYRQISGVAQDSLQYALNAYGKAIQRDPLNPVLRMNVGGIYLSINNPDMAIRFFTDAANLKPDMANAYFNLAIAYNQKKDIANAVLAAQKTVSLLDPKSEDYKVASDVLAQLKDKFASESAKAQAEQQAKQQTTQQQTLQNAGQQSSPLQDKNLPKVTNIPKQESVATPEAIKKTPTPTP